MVVVVGVDYVDVIDDDDDFVVAVDDYENEFITAVAFNIEYNSIPYHIIHRTSLRHTPPIPWETAMKMIRSTKQPSISVVSWICTSLLPQGRNSISYSQSMYGLAWREIVCYIGMNDGYLLLEFKKYI